MERHKCKLCLKSFSNGRALGGHMRSHMLNLPIPPKPEEQEQELPIDQELNEDVVSASSSSASEEEELEEQGKLSYNNINYGLRENPKRSIRLVDPEFSFGVDTAAAAAAVTAADTSVVLQDRESETESSKNPTRRRSKRTRKLLEQHIPNQNHHHNYYREEEKIKKIKNCAESWEPEPVSSISDTTTEEDVAFCLMMLSRDKLWKQKEQEELLVQEEDEEDEDEDDEEEEEKSFEENDESDEFNKSCKAKTRGKYKCETCNKVFKSYQALGGHRASHKKLKLNAKSLSKEKDFTELETENAGSLKHINSVVEKKVHECPYCFRVFSSGQALGGHKRSHVTGVAAATASTTTLARSSSKLGDNLSLIDLNLPAPFDDDDISQIELSAVSDAEFVNYHYNIKR